MKKLILAAAVAAAYTGSAIAAVNLDAGTGSGGVYVAEAEINATTGTNLNDGADADQDATVTFGASFASGFVAYVRFDLSSGTFTAAPTYTVNDSNGAASVSVAQGGVGFGYVIFAVAPSAGDSLVSTNTGTFSADGVTVKTKDTVNLSYKLFETLTNAANNTLALKTVAAVPYISFAKAITVTAGTTVTSTADVATATGAYTKFLGGVTEVPVLSFTVTHTPRALPATGVNTTAAGDVLSDANDLTVTGDFSARLTATTGVTLDTSSTCAGAGIAATTINNSSAFFDNLSAAQIAPGGPLYVCYQVNGTSAIPLSGYTGLLNLDGDPGFELGSDVATGSGSIIRNGTVLKAAFAEGTTAGGFSTTINLTNTSSLSATFTTRCLTATGAITGLGGTVTAGQGARFGVTSASGLNCPSNVRGVELTFSVPNGSVIGSAVRQNTTTGVASFDSMTGNQ